MAIEESTPVLRVYPTPGHPSSFWPAEELILADASQSNPFVLPHEIGIRGDLERRVLTWTKEFHRGFIDYSDNFTLRPFWKAHIDPITWYEEGVSIVTALRLPLPEVHVIPQFAHLVYSINERRENVGLRPINPPGLDLPGHIALSEASLCTCHR
ncbi:hypothetical protein [Corynebacterium nasicanis]|uniref:Uncharacterized protein n=1 Tax=Corynebacterium nasicanis TaxID=1448267 RepID=A0ABW1QG34_9CORY